MPACVPANLRCGRLPHLDRFARAIDNDALLIELSRLAPGDFFGKDGLFTGAGETGTVRALTFVVAYEVGQATLAKLMRDRPSIAEEISLTLTRRAKRGTSGIGADDGAATLPSLSVLVTRIRQLFEVPHG